MAVRNIRKEGDAILRKVSKEVPEINDKVIELLEDMKNTMDEANGIGLAAVQVGILKRIFIVDIGEGVMELINPQLISQGGEQVEVEGCLSIPGVYGEVQRPKKVVFQAQNRQGEMVTIEGEGLLARVLCHEMDHLNGVLFRDKVLKYIEVEKEEDDA